MIQIKANFAALDKEVTVYFHRVAGKTAECFYCKKAGATESKTVIKEVICDGATVNPRSHLYAAAKLRLEALMFSGRGVHIGTKCEDAMIEECSSNPDMVYDLE